MTRPARRRDLRLIPAALLVWAAAGVATSHPATAGVLALILWASTVLALAGLRRRSRARSRHVGAVVVLAFGCALAGAVATHVVVVQPERDRVASLPLSGGRAVTIEAAVTGKVERAPAGWRLDAAATRMVAGETGITGGALPITVRTSERPAGLDLGSTVSVTGTAFPARAGERAVVVVDAATPPVVGSEPRGVLAVAADLRQGLLVQAATLPQPGAGLIAGLAVGDTAAVSDQLDDQMKLASLSHLTAVSGANCALVVGIAFGVAAAAGLRRRWRVIAGLTVLVAFVVLVSPEPSVVRAAAMAAIAMLATLLGRSGAGAAVLSLAVSACLLADPWLATSLGFALSAAATCALLLVAGPVSDTITRIMPKPLALAIAVPLAAQLACTPLIVLIEPRLPVYAVLANILTAPAAPLATVAGLAACVTAGIPVIGAGLAAVAWVPCAWIAATAAWVSTLPITSLPWLPDLGGALAALVLCAATVILLLPAAPRLLVRCAALVLAVVIGVSGGLAVVTGPVARAGVPGAWAIAQCDVGQGDAVLLRSEGRVALVDTGADAEALTTCLALFGVESVDLLVLTHFDVDHSGGAAAVVGRAARVLHGPVADAADDDLLERLRDSGAEVVPAAAGMTGTLGGAAWEILWPRQRGVVFAPGNDASVVMAVRGGGIPPVILLGDLSESPQLILAGSLDETFEVVKVAHHGSADQAAALYRRIRARVALIGVGDNDYGHPRAETLTMLADTATLAVRSDTDGASALLIGEDGLALWRQRASRSSRPTGVRGRD